MKPNPLHRFRSARAAGALSTFLLLPMAVPVSAVDRIWTGDGSGDNWSIADNWGGTAPVGGTITTPGDRLVFAGSNKLTTNNNDYSDGSSLVFGGIRFDAAAGAFTLSGNRLRMSGNIDFLANPSSAVTHTINHDFLIVATLSVTTQPNGSIMIGGVIGDGGSNLRVVNMGGTGTLTLNAANTFGGQARLNGGTVNAKVIANAGVASSLGKANGTTGATTPTLRIGNGAATVTLAYTGVAAASTDRQVQVGIGTGVGDTGGANFLNNLANTAHTLTFSNAAFNVADATAGAARTVTLGGTNTGLNTISGAIINNNATTGIVSLAKADAGTWVLGGASTYTGTTTVSGGTLRVNGSLGDTALTVDSGATLGGSGTIGTSSVLNTLAVNGTLAPGNSAGVLTVNDNLDLNGSLSVEVNGTTAGTGYDQVTVNGAVDVTGSSLAATFTTFAPADGDKIFIVINDGGDAVTGTFNGLAQDAVVSYYGGLLWKISYNANSAGGTFNGGNDIALFAVPNPNPPVTVSSWTFDSGATPNARLASSGTATGLTVSQLTFHPAFNAVPALVNNEETTLNALSTNDRWAADSGIGILRMRRADYLQESAPPGRSATYNSTSTATSGAAGTLGAPIWFSVTTDSLTEATIHAIAITNPGGGSAATYHFAKSGDPLGTGVSDVQPTIHLPTPITLGANETAFFSINIGSAATATNNNINQINLLGTTEALPPPPPPIGLVTSTLTVGAPHGTYNRLSVTIDPDLLAASSDTTDLTGTIGVTVNIDPVTGKTPLLTLSAGRVNGTDMSFSALGYNLSSANLSAAINTIAPPGTVDPDTGVFAANQHNFIVDQGAFTGTAAGNPVNITLSPTATLAGLGTGNGSLTLTPAGTSGPYKLFNAVVVLPVALSQTETTSGIDVLITATGTVRATGQIQMPSSEFNAWMLGQGATSFDPDGDTAGNGAPDGIKWALGLDLYDDPMPFLLKPHPTIPGTFTISLPPGGTVAPLTVESSTNLLSPWANVPAGQMAPAANPIPEGSTGTINITPTAANRIFLRTRANP